MQKHTTSHVSVSTIVILLLFALGQAAEGQATRTWVSVYGNDANDCSRATPCRTLSGALAKSSDGGEIDILDSGGFGSVTIDKSISVIAPPEVLGGVQASTGNAITISAGPNDTVALRGLTIEGLGTGLAGIKVLAVGALHVENCTINNFTQIGIDFVPTSLTITNAQLHVSNTIVRNNNGASSGGIRVKPGNNVSVIGMIKDTQLRNNQFGLRVEDNSKVTAKNTTTSGNSNSGFVVVSNGAAVNLNLDSCIAAGNGFGIRADGSNASVRFANSIIAGNGIGISSNASGRTVSFTGTNFNADTGTATGPNISPQR